MLKFNTSFTYIAYIFFIRKDLKSLNMNLCQLNEKTKRSNLIMLFNETKLDKLKIKEHFLENHASVPQEYRLATWKSLLGSFQLFKSKQIQKIIY